MNPDQTKTKKALKNLDWLALRQELEAVDLTDKNLQIVLMMVLRSDSMVRRRPGNDGATRDHLLMELESYLQEKGLEEAASIVSELHKIFRCIDKGYVAIFAQEEKLQFSSLSPEKESVRFSRFSRT